MIYGLDVSSYQPEHFRLTMPGTGDPVSFVIIKVTQGTDYTNPKWLAQLDWARQNNLAVGFYHFGEAGQTMEQVQYFVETLGDRVKPGDTLWYDWEATNGSAPTNEEKDRWIKNVQGVKPGHRVGLYCNVDYWKNRDTTSFAGDALWIAHWDDTDPPIEHPWVVHQFSEDGIDQNRARFDSKEQLLTWAGAAGNPEQPDPTTVMEAVVRLDAKVDEVLRRLGKSPS